LSINKNQQVYNLTLNPDSPTKYKIQKTISECQNMTNLINDDIDDIDDNDVIITYIKKLTIKTMCYVLWFFNGRSRNT